MKKEDKSSDINIVGSGSFAPTPIHAEKGVDYERIWNFWHEMHFHYPFNNKKEFEIIAREFLRK